MKGRALHGTGKGGTIEKGRGRGRGVTHTAGWNIAGHRRESCVLHSYAQRRIADGQEGGGEKCPLITATAGSGNHLMARG